MKQDTKKRLKTILTIDMVLGVLMMLPLLSSILPGNPFNVAFEEHREALKIVLGLVLWTVAITWVVRLRKVKNIQIVVPVLVLVGGLVTTCFFILAYVGAGILTIALSPVIPFIYSRPHVNYLLSLNAE